MTGRTTRWRLSLRHRITLLATAIVTVLLAGGGILLLRDSRAALERSLDAQVAGVAQEVAGQLRGGTEPAAVLLQPGGGPFALPTVQIRDLDGTVLASVAAGLALEFGEEGPVLRDRERAVPLGPQLAPPPAPLPPVPDLDGPDRPAGWSVSRVVVERAGPDYVVLAGSPYTIVQPALDPFASRLRIAIPLAGLLAGGLAFLGVRRALRPVELLRTEVEAVTESSLSRRVPEPPTHDEIGRLARTFNGMLGRLERAQSRQRQFVSDASHELRSPVTVLRSSLEVAAAHPDTTDWPATVGDLLAVTDRLDRLVDDLLALARQGEQRTDEERDEVDLDDVVRDEVRGRRSTGLALVRADAVKVIGRRADLGRVVANLLDNASRWAAVKVEVTLRRDGVTAVLVVDDDGPGIAPEDRDRIFDRFVRLDAARGRTSGGAGLGLAVVRETVHAHGGTVSVAESPAGGSRFVVVLPALP